jgi:hypothetical protein
MSLPHDDLNPMSEFANKPGGEGGTPGLQEDNLEGAGEEIEETSKPGGEGGTPGV